MKVLVLGYGSMGKRHAANATELGHEVKVHDPYPSDDAGVSMVKERAAWRWKPEAVVVASPVATHAALTRKALEAGARVYVEKPLALSVEDFCRALPGDTDYGGRVTVGYNLRHHAGLLHMRRYQLPRIGDPLAARLQVCCDMSKWPGSSYGPPALELSHEVDLALWLLGPARLAGRWPDHGGALVTELLLAHERGAQASSAIRLDGRFPGYRRGGEVVGSEGILRWAWQGDQPHGRFDSRVTGPSGGKAVASYACDAPVEATYRAALAAWLAGSTSEGASLADGLAALHLVGPPPAGAKTDRG